MRRSITPLATLLGELEARARRKGWTDAEWSRRSGVPKETLCRLKSRATCDFATLHALAAATGGTLDVRDRESGTRADRQWPTVVDRTLEARLVDLAASRSMDLEEWRRLGPPFFLAGIAVMLASVDGYDRQALLGVAEALHSGATEPRVFSRWLAETPLPPSRFLPMLSARSRHAA